MFKVKSSIISSIVAILLMHSPSVFAAEPEETIPNQIEQSSETFSEVLGYYQTKEGQISIKETPGIAERLPAGTTLGDILESHPMSSEAEAKLVHREPRVPFFLDGSLYKPDQIHLFDGQRLGFTIGEDGFLYAFLSYDAMESFLLYQQSSLQKSDKSEYSSFYDLVNCTGIDKIMLPPNVALYSLSYLNNAISSAEISSYATCGSTLFEYENLQGNYLNIPSGVERDDLGDYGWDDRASSLVVWP